ncbi:MAG: hypothetical protein U9N07_03230, partial [Euryarchaeota archaeon]|nr:hypothetical protein [Euryarchaeota archaeon]
MNIVNMVDSPDFVKPAYYTREFADEFGIPLVSRKQRITFTHNGDRTIHRWSPYIQGFSASGVYVRKKKRSGRTTRSEAWSGGRSVFAVWLLRRRALAIAFVRAQMPP